LWLSDPMFYVVLLCGKSCQREWGIVGVRDIRGRHLILVSSQAVCALHSTTHHLGSTKFLTTSQSLTTLRKVELSVKFIAQISIKVDYFISHYELKMD
jgi:hypothetical protein